MTQKDEDARREAVDRKKDAEALREAVALRRGAVDRNALLEAIEESRKCEPSRSAYSVGAMIVTARGEKFKGYTHETGPANHAEEEALMKALAAGVDLHGATMYSSMEPCSKRGSKPVSCSELIIDHGFGRVVYALDEPDLFVDCVGAGLMRSAGIEVVTLPELAQDVRRINSHILG